MNRADKLPYKCNAGLDTWADKNCISEDFCEHLDYRSSIKSSEGSHCIAANSQSVATIGSVSLTLIWEHGEEGTQVEKNTFLVVPGLPIAMILGHKFIERNHIMRRNENLLPIILAPITKQSKADNTRRTQQIKAARQIEEDNDSKERKAARENERKGLRSSQNTLERPMSLSGSSHAGGSTTSAATLSSSSHSISMDHTDVSTTSVATGSSCDSTTGMPVQ